MLEHPRLTTCHLYDVPRGVVHRLCQLSVLCYHHHPRHAGFAHTRALSSLIRKVKASVPLRASQLQEQVITSLLEVLAAKGSHTLFVVQPFNQVEEVLLCLMDNQHLLEVQSLASRFGDCPVAI